MTPRLLLAETRSARDDAWSLEIAEVLARGWSAWLQGARNEAADVAPTLLAWIASGQPGDSPVCAEFVQRLLHSPPPTNLKANACELLALAHSGYAARVRCASRIHESLERLLDAHQRDGGWGETQSGKPQVPSCPIVTACVLEALGAFGFRLGQTMVADAVNYIFSQQEETGLWTDPRQVFAGLAAIGYDMTAMPLCRAVCRLKELQNEEGGWGTPRSTVAATANAVLALLIADEPHSAEVRAGVEFLVGTQRADGLWNTANSLVLHAVGRYACSVGALEEPNVLGALGPAAGSALPAPGAA